jgi:hypothetical protein
MKFGSQFIRLSCQCAVVGFTVATASTLFAPMAKAGDVDNENFPVVQGVRFGQIPYEFEQTFFSHDRDYYRNREILGQFKWLFGPFTENSMAKDGKDVNKLYQRTMFQQMNSGPIVRTLDLPSPFSYSVRTLPPPVVAVPVEVVPAPIAPAVPQAPASPQKPVPALW